MGDQGVTMPGLFTMSPTWDHDPLRDASSTCILRRIPEERPQPKMRILKDVAPPKSKPEAQQPVKSKAETSDWWRARR